jgi:hypothetical protein
MSPGAFWYDRAASKTRVVFRITPTVVEQTDTPRVIALTFLRLNIFRRSTA